ncbi:MAG: hypothetical protein LQ347_001768 [Umbilicaria vellea]|nr:MAG: hypothetical protein LQ347_001768 [Umbilicaria vellea]
MPGRQPATSDFSPDLQLQGYYHCSTIVTPSSEQSNPLARTGQQQPAPTPLPLDVGVFHGGDDIVFDQAAGPMDIDTAFKKSGQILTQEVIKNVLLDKCGYRPRDILLFGFGMAALAVVAPMADELGGLISIGGPLPSVSSTASSASRKCMTPVLIIGGSSKTLVTKSAMASLKLTFESVQYTRYTRDGDSMPRNREEMLPIMQFFSPSPKPERSSGGEVEVT